MRLLLDTHALLWFVWNHANLSAPARTLMTDPKNTLLLSAASIWEIVIKDVNCGSTSSPAPLGR